MALNGSKSKGGRAFIETAQYRLQVVFIAILFAMSVGCASFPEKRKDLGFPVNLPFLRMQSDECYYLDDFMPTPDSLVTGKSTGTFLRYYTYHAAIYKVWADEKVMLAFFSRDNRCWSLFEEYNTAKI